jgi:hypothetical protein
MVGASVLVTANTLREVVQHIHDDIHTTPFDREFNAPEPEMEKLAFGDSDAIAPDGRTPLYRITTFGATIVQKYDPDARMPSGWRGRWFNVNPIDDVAPWDDMAPGEFEPVCHGFVISRENVRDGRSDAPLIETTADRQLAALPAAERAVIEGRDAIVEVRITMVDGSEAVMQFDSDAHQSGTSYSGNVPTVVSTVIEEAISKAVTDAGLWP